MFLLNIFETKKYYIWKSLSPTDTIQENIFQGQVNEKTILRLYQVLNGVDRTLKNGFNFFQMKFIIQ